MKKLLLLLLVVCSSMAANAEWRLGASGGASLNWHRTDYGNFAIENKLSWGGTMSLYTQYNFRDWVGLRLDLTMLQRNYDQWYPESGDHAYYIYKRNYHLLPLTASFSYGNNIVRGYIDLGLYVGHWTNAKTSKIIEDEDLDVVWDSYTNIDYTFDSRRDYRFDMGATGRIGLIVFLPKNVYMNVEAVYYQSLLSNHKTGSKYLTQNSYDGTLGLQLGIGYRFNKTENQ